MFSAEIFKHAGIGLISTITRVLNNIKNHLVIPSSWIHVIIVTLYKNKGSKKRLKNHRGIFLCAILSKVMEKLIKNRTREQFRNINCLQFGATENCSTADCTFIIRSLIDHAVYLNKPLFLTLYDYSTCFDSLWLEDTMLSLWDIDIRNELFPLIYEMNKQSLISVRTPFGTSKQFSCPSIVKQGAVLSTNLCGSSTGKLISDLDVTDECGASIGSTVIKGVMFVDDTTTVNRTHIGAINSNNTVTAFSRKKRLALNTSKCVLLAVNVKKSDLPPNLMIGDEEIECVTSAKCLGDIFTGSGSNDKLVTDRVNRGKGIIVTATSLCNDITLGQLDN